MDNNDEYLTPGQAAKLLGVSPKTLSRWADDGSVPVIVTLGGHRRFRASVIEALRREMGIEG